MKLAPALYTQSALALEIKRRMRDTANDRWTDEEIYDAINDALADWEGRVQVPRYYDISFTSGTYEYTLPSYIDTAHLDVQIKRTIWGLDTETGEEWEEVYEDLTSWYVIPSSTGGMTLVIENIIESTDGRIIWWGYNGAVPVIEPTVKTAIDSDDTQLVLSGLVTGIGKAGYVKVDEEWMSYSGYEDDGTNTTLSNLVRGLDDTTADAHTADTVVSFGIAMPNERLRRLLFDQVAARMHALFLTNAAPNEQEHHERLMGFYENRVKDFWRTWIPLRAPKMRLSRRSVGEVIEGTRWT